MPRNPEYSCHCCWHPHNSTTVVKTGADLADDSVDTQFLQFIIHLKINTGHHHCIGRLGLSRKTEASPQNDPEQQVLTSSLLGLYSAHSKYNFQTSQRKVDHRVPLARPRSILRAVSLKYRQDRRLLNTHDDSKDFGKRSSNKNVWSVATSPSTASNIRLALDVPKNRCKSPQENTGLDFLDWARRSEK